MQYKYETTDRDFSDFASGRVFYSLPGHPAFPVRLASEIFQRCLAHREALYGVTTPCRLYDPCCGAAYHLSVLAYLHRKHIREIIASDIDEKAAELAKRNLGLISLEGLDQRISEIQTMIEQYNKDSHREALKSAYALEAKVSVEEPQYPISTETFPSSAIDGRTMLEHIKPNSVDIVFTDVPYGQHSEWQKTDGSSNPIASLLEALTPVLSDSGIVAIASDKGQKASHGAYQRLEQFQIGKRRVVILKLAAR